MVEVLRKYKSRGNKIVQVNSIRITKSINLLLFCPCDDIFKLTARAQSINREMYGPDYFIIRYFFNFGKVKIKFKNRIFGLHKHEQGQNSNFELYFNPAEIEKNILLLLLKYSQQWKVGRE